MSAIPSESVIPSEGRAPGFACLFDGHGIHVRTIDSVIIVLVIEQYKKRNVKNEPCKVFIQRAVSTLSKRPDWFETIGEFALPGDAGRGAAKKRQGGMSFQPRRPAVIKLVSHEACLWEAPFRFAARSLK